MTRPLKLDKRGKLLIPEADVQKACDDLLEAHGWKVIPQPVTVPCQNCGNPVYLPGAHRGQPDRLAIRGDPLEETPISAVFIEYKRRGKKPTREQRIYHEFLHKQGFTVIAPDSLEKLAEWMGVKL